MKDSSHELAFIILVKELVSLSSVRICHALLRTRITNESNFLHGKSYRQGVLKVSDL